MEVRSLLYMLLSLISQQLPVFECIHISIFLDGLLLLVSIVFLHILLAVAERRGVYSVYTIHLIPE